MEQPIVLTDSMLLLTIRYLLQAVLTSCEFITFDAQ